MTIVVIKCVKNLSLSKSWNRLSTFAGITMNDLNLKSEISKRGKDNGILSVVALQDHKCRIEVGYGLEGVLPDSLIGTIGRDYAVPYFRKNEYSNGISAANPGHRQSHRRRCKGIFRQEKEKIFRRPR